MSSWLFPQAYKAIFAADGAGGLTGGLVAMRLRPRRPLLVALVTSVGLGPTPLLVGLKLPLTFVLIFGAAWMVATTLPLLLVGDIRRLPWKGA